MKIYTRTGDDGETSLFGGGRVRKDNLRIETYGTVDELNAVIGIVRSELSRETAADYSFRTPLDELFAKIQHHLFDLGAELATPDAAKHGTELLTLENVTELENAIDKYEESLDPLKQFILPGGSALASELHLARCVCRRAERLMVGIDTPQPVREIALQYVNRLSDLLFVLARAANAAIGQADVPWQKEG